ncbi:hypothetical protein [Streptomyces sp. NPDC099088]|uniref:hypothetical protein n=1 Tax=Streptomyces sp. NPDC099088 TaxID=3366101 RepID=UPI00382237CF
MDRLAVTLIHLRHNLPHAMPALLYNVDPSTVTSGGPQGRRGTPLPTDLDQRDAVRRLLRRTARSVTRRAPAPEFRNFARARGYDHTPPAPRPHRQHRLTRRSGLRARGVRMAITAASRRTATPSRQCSCRRTCSVPP